MISVSQVEYGVLHLMDNEHSRITVMVDCEGLSPLKFPMQISLTCSNILQDHFPKRLGCVYVLRLPPVARVIAQTFIQVSFSHSVFNLISTIFASFFSYLRLENNIYTTQFLKPGTREKLKILGETYREALSDCVETLPLCLGGLCTCMTCARHELCNRQQSCVTETCLADSIADITTEEVMPTLDPSYDTDRLVTACGEQVLRKAIVGVLIFWVLIAFFAGVYDLES